LNVTRRLGELAPRQIAGLAETSGYVVKKDSPDRGMERVRVRSPRGGPAERRGVGISARTLTERMSLF
jgi:uncharacterized protein YbbK (DUF523 family)